MKNQKKSTIERISLFFLVSFLFFNSSIFSQNFVWAKSFGGNGNEHGFSVCSDASGNVYTTGLFDGTVDFDPGPGVVNLTSTGAADVFITKLNSVGNLVWVKSFGGVPANNDVGSSITTDASGNVYTTGYFYGTVDFDPGPSTFTLTSVAYDIFISKLDASGNFIWAKQMGGSDSESSLSIKIDATGNVYTTGYFKGTVDFDPGIGVNNLSAPALFNTIFLSKLDASGNFVWAKSIGGTVGNDYGRSITTDPAGNVYATGCYNGTNIDFDPGVGTSTLSAANLTDVFVLKLDGAGNFILAKSLGGTGMDDSYGIAVDPSGNIHTSGIFNGTADFDPGVGLFNLSASGGSHSFVSKLDVTGNFVWAKSWGAATGTSSGNGIALDASGNVYTTGSFEMFVDFDPGPGIANLMASNSDIFISKLDNGGNYVWAKALSGSMNEFGTSINVDAIGNVYTTGYFGGTVDFDPSPSSFTIASTMSSIDAYVHKMCQLPVTPGVISGTTSACFGAAYTYSVVNDPFSTSYTWGLPSGWGGTSSTNTVSGTPGNSGSIFISANNACGSSSIQTLSVTVLPANLNLGSNFALACRQKQFINASSTPSAPTSVIWTPTVGLSNATVFTPTAIGTGISTTYSVTVNLSNGCVVNSTLGVTALTQVPDICQVTVDSLGINNEIYWDKTLYPAADSFFVYRETSLNVYKKIAGLSRTAFSMYVDTNRTIGPANGNPNATYYKYKLQMRDSCGNYSALSKWHETIFIQDQSNGNFNWNSYAIESSTSPISIYNLKRRDLTVGTETIVTSTTGGLANDALYNTVWPTNIKWFVDAVGFSCNATAKTMVLKTKTKSNQSNDKQFIGIKELEFDGKVILYPNPATDVLNVDLNSLPKTETTTEIRNALGQVVYQTKSLNQHLVINTSSLAGGVYMVNIKQNDRIIAIKKVVISK
jgi:hypothetical protein